ncbi:MAG: OmpA family protein [Gemmatimonadetes bacterium]|nr:OmpA family protein [Gemmatimonadota bacterium]
MGRGITLRTRLIRGAALTFAGITAACAHVGQEQFDTEMAALRAEMEQTASGSDLRTEGQLARLEARLDGLARGLSALEGEFDVTVQRLETAIRFDMPVYFPFDKADLRPEDLPVLDRFAGVVAEFYPDALLTVEGFTDPTGSATYNLALGLRRAEAVQRYLVESEDFSPERVRAVSYGEDASRLVAPGQGGQLAGWENRRVVLVIEHLGYVTDTALVTGGEL